jgi:hypothetical protein
LDAEDRKIGGGNIVPDNAALVVVAQAADIPGTEDQLTKVLIIHYRQQHRGEPNTTALDKQQITGGRAKRDGGTQPGHTGPT